MQRREARERMLDGPLLFDGSFRQEIISSWRRCRLVGVVPTAEDVPYQPEFERPNRLLRAAGPVIDRLADQFKDGPVSILLADAEAQIIDRRAGGRELAQALDKALVSPGFRYAEEFTGTNGIGSALEERRPFVVSGAEHFRENLQVIGGLGCEEGASETVAVVDRGPARGVERRRVTSQGLLAGAASPSAITMCCRGW